MDNETKEQLWEQFMALEARAISMNHYDLARVTSIQDVQLWKKFLTDPEVSAYIEQEASILAQTELRKLAQDVSDSRSVGQAQLINAMSKLTDTKSTKEGPIFIYTYVPLSKNQLQAKNVEIEKEDIFARKPVTDEPTEVSEMKLKIKDELSDDELF